MEYTDEQLAMMSDEELEAAFREARAAETSPETILEQESEVEPDISSDEEEMIEFDDDENSEEDELELEQPVDDEDSDDNSSDDEEEDELDENSEAEEDDLDEDSDTVDEDTTDNESELEAEEQPVRRKYRANGKEYEFTEEEIFEKFGNVFGQAMNYTQKMQTIKPWRKTIDAIEQANLTAEDINLAIDVLKGDKDAISSLLKQTGIDALELDVENTNYQPKDYGRNDTELAIKEVVDEIKNDKEYNITYDVLEKQWDSKSREAFVENPEMIRQLHIDVKSGMYDTIAPIANKLKVYDGGGKSDLEYYTEAAAQYFEQQERIAESTRRVEEKTDRSNEISRVKSATQKRTATKASSAKRKAAAPTKKVAGAAKRIDFLDDSDEAFDDWYKKLENSI